MPVNLLTFEERKQIEELIAKGATFPQIGELIGRSKNTVRNEVRKLGQREDYNAKKAQVLCDTAGDRRRNSILKWREANVIKITPNTIKKRQERLSNRVSVIEQKLELIIKILKEAKANGINDKL